MTCIGVKLPSATKSIMSALDADTTVYYFSSCTTSAALAMESSADWFLHVCSEHAVTNMVTKITNFTFIKVSNSFFVRCLFLYITITLWPRI